MNRRVVFLYTDYQLKVYRDLCHFESRSLDSDVLIYMSGVSKLFDIKPAGLHRISLPDRGVGLLEAIELKKRIKEIASIYSEENFDFYLASDDHPISSLIRAFFHINKIYLFEDGIGSYVVHRKFMVSRGVRAVLAKIKNALLYFPFFSSYYGCGANFKAHVCYSYSDFSFPHQFCSKILIPERKLAFEKIESDFYISNNSVVVFGQPLSLDFNISYDSYFDVILKSLEKLKISERTIYYKTHPRENGVDIKSHFFKRGLEVVVYDGKCLGEDFIHDGASGVVVISFLSTLLPKMKSKKNIDSVYFIKSGLLKVPSSYYDYLLLSGVEMVEIP